MNGVSGCARSVGVCPDGAVCPAQAAVVTRPQASPAVCGTLRPARAVMAGGPGLSAALSVLARLLGCAAPAECWPFVARLTVRTPPAAGTANLNVRPRHAEPACRDHLPEGRGVCHRAADQLTPPDLGHPGPRLPLTGSLQPRQLHDPACARSRTRNSDTEILQPPGPVRVILRPHLASLLFHPERCRPRRGLCGRLKAASSRHGGSSASSRGCGSACCTAGQLRTAGAG
jgi:hypothetical protein